MLRIQIRLKNSVKGSWVQILDGWGQRWDKVGSLRVMMQYWGDGVYTKWNMTKVQGFGMQIFWGQGKALLDGNTSTSYMPRVFRHHQPILHFETRQLFIQAMQLELSKWNISDWSKNGMVRPVLAGPVCQPVNLFLIYLYY